MSKLVRIRNRMEDDNDINMVPIMNMFLVLIPFLLMSASFLHLKAINTSIPILGNTDNKSIKTQNIKVTAIVQITRRGFLLSVRSDVVAHDMISKFDRRVKKRKREKYPFGELAAWLQEIKKSYPASDTIIIIPGQETLYDTIIQAMDAARYSPAELVLFPNVVLSGTVG